MRSISTAAAALLAGTLVLGGCSDTSTSGTSTSTSTSSGAGTSIDIRVQNGTVTPNGDRVRATVGKPITLRIRADTAGEIHVHSSPEQEIEFPRGSSTRTLRIDRPGIVDVEDHALDKVIVQLQVS